jgi:hypothetical protein
MLLTTGFSFAKPVLYLSTDTNNRLTATLEGATYAPGLRTFRAVATIAFSVLSSASSSLSTVARARKIRSVRA